MPVRDRLNEGAPGDQIFVGDRSETPCQPPSFKAGGIFLPEIRNNSEARLPQKAQMGGVRLAIQQPSSPAVNDLPFQVGIGPVSVPLLRSPVRSKIDGVRHVAVRLQPLK